MSFHLSILGSSSAAPTSERHSSAQVLDNGHGLFLLDCAEGTQMQLRRMKIRFQRINHIFISHLHGDHFFGLVGLLTTYHLLGREKALHVHGLPELKALIDHILAVSQTRLVYPLVFHFFDPGEVAIIHQDKHLEVSTLPLLHGIPTCGFLFREKTLSRKVSKAAIRDQGIPFSAFSRLQMGEDVILEDGRRLKNADYTLPPPKSVSFAYCSDTAFNPGLVSKIQGIDYLFHESTFMESEKRQAREKMHSTAAEAAQIAKMAGVKQLILGHFSARYKSLDLLLEEARAVFPNSLLAEEGSVYLLD